MKHTQLWRPGIIQLSDCFSLRIYQLEPDGKGMRLHDWHLMTNIVIGERFGVQGRACPIPGDGEALARPA